MPSQTCFSSRRFKSVNTIFSAENLRCKVNDTQPDLTNKLFELQFTKKAIPKKSLIISIVCHSIFVAMGFLALASTSPMTLEFAAAEIEFLSTDQPVQILNNSSLSQSDIKQSPEQEQVVPLQSMPEQILSQQDTSVQFAEAAQQPVYEYSETPIRNALKKVPARQKPVKRLQRDVLHQTRERAKSVKRKEFNESHKKNLVQTPSNKSHHDSSTHDEISIINTQSRSDYAGFVLSQINASKYYPQAARNQSSTGVVGVRFSIAKSGRVTSVFIARSSGNELLDDAARQAEFAVNAPSPPEGVFNGSTNIRFNLSR